MPVLDTGIHALGATAQKVIPGRRPAAFEEFIRRDPWRNRTADQIGDD